MRKIRWLLIFLLLAFFAVQSLKRQRISYPHTGTRHVAQQTEASSPNEVTATHLASPPPVAAPTAGHPISIVDKMTALENELLSEGLQARANQQLTEMMTSGSRGEVAAILLRFEKLPEFAKATIVKEQSSLCRFQNSQDQPSFDWLKAKFSFASEGVFAVQPWSDVCKG